MNAMLPSYRLNHRLGRVWFKGVLTVFYESRVMLS
jgi:hypothetical protein